jgi:cytochrome c553
MRLLIILLFCTSPLYAFALNGEQIFESKCISCHGDTNTFPNVPALAGQEPAYIKIQLRSFAAGERTDHNMGVMNTIAKGLSEQDIASVATYIAGLEPCLTEVVVNREATDFIENYKAGSKLVVDNNCMHCHGNFHHAAPRLMGQKKEYLTHTLTEFMSGDRTNKYMDRILPILNQDSINKITTYFNAQRLMRECNIK